MIGDTAQVMSRQRRRSPLSVEGRPTSALRYAALALLAALVVSPLVYAALSGFRTTGQLAGKPFALPSPWVISNYVNVLTSESFWTQVANSVTIAVGTTALALVVASPAAYVLGRVAFPGRDLIFNLFALGLLFPLTVAILPVYLTVRDMGLTDNLIGVILPQAAFELPVSIIVLRGFFRSIPKELEEAAMMDGCSYVGFLVRILLPLSRPALGTIGIISIVNSWNAFLLPLLVLSEPDSWTLPLGVMNFSTRYSSDTAGVFAFTTLSMVPALLFFVLAERQLIRGLTAGAVKG